MLPLPSRIVTDRKWLPDPFAIINLVSKSYQQPIIHIVFNKPLPFEGDTNVLLQVNLIPLFSKKIALLAGNPGGKSSFCIIIPIGQRKFIFYRRIPVKFYHSFGWHPIYLLFQEKNRVRIDTYLLKIRLRQLDSVRCCCPGTHSY